MIGWWKRSLAGQFIGFMLLALFIGQAIAFAISWNERQSALRESAQTEFVSRTATLSDVLVTIPATIRRDVLLASATAYSRFWISKEDPRTDGQSWHDRAISYLEEPLSDIISRQATAETRHPSQAVDIERPLDSSLTGWDTLNSTLWTHKEPASVLNFDGLDGMGLVVKLNDGSWLSAAYHKPLTPDIWRAQSLLSIAITALILSLIGIFSANRLARPLRELASSAEALGRGEVVSSIPEQGPDDIRQLCEAFNRMQSRLRRFIDDRTRMLAAIGHDLRTPLTTLRLRAEFVADSDLQDKMLATIHEMQTMTEATLSFAKGEATVEETRTVDLNSLVESLCDDLAELGHDIDYVETGKLSYRCRPDGLKRAVRNLVENALRYGGRASVGVRCTATSVDIIVEDHGPGIPAEEIEHVFAPFYRLEQSRSRETGGVGLGLSIARAIVRHHGGDIVLTPNNPGLRASVTLPRF